MTDQPIAIALRDAPTYVPLSYDYLYKAVKRTGPNPLPARLVARKYIVTLADLRAWLEKEGVEA